MDRFRNYLDRFRNDLHRFKKLGRFRNHDSETISPDSETIWHPLTLRYKRNYMTEAQPCRDIRFYPPPPPHTHTSVFTLREVDGVTEGKPCRDICYNHPFFILREEDGVTESKPCRARAGFSPGFQVHMFTSFPKSRTLPLSAVLFQLQLRAHSSFRIRV